MSLWDEMSKLQSALTNRAAEVKAKKQAWLQEQQNKVRRHAANSESTLTGLLNWKMLGQGIARLNNGLGNKPPSTLSPLLNSLRPNVSEKTSSFLSKASSASDAWLRFYVAAIFVVLTLLNSGIKSLENFLVFMLMIGFVVWCWFAAKRADEAELKKLQRLLHLRLMRFSRINRESEFPVEFTYLRYDTTSNAVTEEAWGFPESAALTSVCNGKGCAIGFFGDTGQLVGFLSIDSTNNKTLNTFNEGDIALTLQDEVLSPDFAAFNKNDIEAREIHSELQEANNQINDNATFEPSIDVLRDAWSKVILHPDEMENLVRAQMLFAYGDPSAPRGILLKGPPGTGKSLSAQTFAKSSGAHFFKLSIADIKSENIGGSAANVKRIWQQARENVPSIIFIDECEGVFAKRGSDQGDSFVNEVVQTFLTEWDGIGGDDNILVIGATNRAELLDDAIISRFTDILELLPQDSAGITPLVNAIVRQLNLSIVIPPKITESMSGMNGREVRNVIQQAMRLSAPDNPTEEQLSVAIGKIRGKNSTKVADTATWDTLILPGQLKNRIKTLAQMIREADTLTAQGIPVPRTLLLYGPPGTGKTQIARTMANQAGVNFIARSTADLKGQYLGHAASRISQTFETARASSPSILFIDEIDALASSRGENNDQLQAEAVTQLLQELDGVTSKSGYVLVVAATNLLNQLDSAILSRFSQKLEIPLPTQPERAAILQTLLSGCPVAEDIDVHHVASICEGLSGRDLREIVSQAFNLAFQRTIGEGKTAANILLNMIDLKEAIVQA
jgi:SpoVK/Ycf46/Vps4 family AAA+-type ATPase